MTTPEVDQELERLFSVARAATVADAGARERIRAGLAPRVGTNAPRAGSSSWAKAAACVVVVGLCAVAFWFLRAPEVHVALPVAPRVSAPVAAVAPAAPPASAEVAPPAAAKPEQPAPTLEANKAAQAPKASKPAPSVALSADPAEELTLVKAMQQALRSGNASLALALAADHARRFPRGTLVEEREGVRAVAQCELAAPSARAAILAAFSRRFATSPYAARVKAACQ